MMKMRMEKGNQVNQVRYVNIGSGNGLVLSGNNQHAIYLQANVDPVQCHHMVSLLSRPQWVNTLRPRQDGHHFADDTFKRIFFNETFRILIKISLKFVTKGPINNIPALVHIMVWRRPGDKPLSEPMMVSLPTHICVARPQWVNSWNSPVYILHISHHQMA